MVTPTRPLLLVDVDGVLNCFGDLGRSLVSFEQEFVALERYHIRVPLGAAAALTQLSSAFKYAWATTRPCSHRTGARVAPCWRPVIADSATRVA